MYPITDFASYGTKIIIPTKSELLCYNLLIDAIPNVTLMCGTIVDIVGNKRFDNIYKRDMKGLVGEFYRRSNAVIANFNMGMIAKHCLH